MNCEHKVSVVHDYCPVARTHMHIHCRSSLPHPSKNVLGQWEGMGNLTIRSIRPHDQDLSGDNCKLIIFFIPCMQLRCMQRHNIISTELNEISHDITIYLLWSRNDHHINRIRQNLTHVALSIDIDSTKIQKYDY